MVSDLSAVSVPVMTLRQFQKEATACRDNKQEVFNKQLKETEKKDFPSVRMFFENNNNKKKNPTVVDICFPLISSVL